MTRKHVVGVVVVFVLAAGLGLAYFLGVGPAPGGGGDSIEEFPTAGEGSGDSDDGDLSDSSASSEEGPFSFTVDEVEECGRTCRDVTATVYNEQDEPASGVTVYTRVFAGENNTDRDDVVWEGSDEVGALEAGTSYTGTERIELSYRDGLKVDREDGWITILTTVESDETTVTFRDSEQVA